MTLVYVVAGQNERFVNMALLSALTSRRVHPQARIEVFRWTKNALTPAWRNLARTVDRIHEIEVPDCACPVEASRFLKITARHRLNGPFVYVDVDTLWVAPFPAHLLASGKIMAARDRYRNAPLPRWPGWVEPTFSRCDWPYPTRRYYNSGVIVWPDSPAATLFAEQWLTRWRHSTRLTGRAIDQPAFNSLLDQTPKAHFSLLPDTCNALVDADPHLARGACLWHFFNYPDEDNLLNNLLEARSCGQPDWARYEQAVAQRWPGPGPLQPWWRVRLDFWRRAWRQLKRERKQRGRAPAQPVQ